MRRSASALATLTLLGLILPVHRTPMVSARADEGEPDRATLTEAGRATSVRLQRQGASWTATVQPVGLGTRFITEVVSAPGMKRLVIASETQGRRKEMNTIIMRDGLWYFLNPAGKPARYRPYEAPIGNPMFYTYIVNAEPRLVGQEHALADQATFETAEGGVATYRTPLPANSRQRLENIARQSERRQEHVDWLRDRLDKGLPTRVECASGMIVEHGGTELRVVIGDFRWLDSADPRDFSIAGIDATDHTSDLTRGDCNDLIMMGFSATGQSGGSPLTDGRLIDLWSGTIRRIPFRGTVATPGCFLKGRTRVVIGGYDTATRMQRLYEIDLRTGANRRLGGELLASGSTFSPAVSPDGATVAVTHHGPTDPPNVTRVCLVDLKSGQATAIGEPGEYTHPTWLPDGRGLVIGVFRPGAMAGQKIATIERMDLEGHLTKVCDGQMPTLLASGKTILFRDARAGLWKTCDLTGSEVNRYADGLQDYTQPALSPDGQKLLMMRMHVGRPAEPTILLLGESEGEPATLVRGYWAFPVWR